MKARKPDRTDVAQKIGETLRRRPNTPKLETWNDLVDNLKKMKVTPGEAYRKLTSENIRFNWKMMRLTMYVWERLKEDKSQYLKPKIDTVRAVVKTRRFEDFFMAIFLTLNLMKKEKLNY